MRRMAASVATALACFSAPMRRPRPARWAPAENRPASPDALDRLQLGHFRTAFVTSLWAARPAKQCAIEPRYDLAPGGADFSRVLRIAASTMRTAAPVGARALLARLQAAGISAAEPNAAAEIAPVIKLEARRAA